MKFLDSNVLAYAFYENTFQDNCQNILREGGTTDTVCLIEAFHILEFQIGREHAIDSLRGLLKSSIEIVEVDVNIFFETLKRSLRYKHLKFIDLIHYTVAVLKECEVIVSYDKDFDKLDISRTES